MLAANLYFIVVKNINMLIGRLINTCKKPDTTKPAYLRSKDLIQALSPYLDDVKNLGKIVHDYVGRPFISTWLVDGKYKHEITLSLERDGEYNFLVDWSDGKSDRITSFYQVETSHEYKEAGRYIVQLDGVVNGFRFSDMTGARPKPHHLASKSLTSHSGAVWV